MTNQMVTYQGAGKRIIMTATKRAELAQAAATKAESIVEQNFLYDNEMDVAEDRAFTYLAFGSFVMAIAITATIFVEGLLL